MNFLFLLKIPVNEPPPGSSTGPLWREMPFYKAFFYILKFLTKISLNKKFSPSLKGPRKGVSLHVPPKQGPYRNTPICRDLLGISFGVPSKGALPPVSSHRVPSKRDAPFLEPSFINLSVSLVNEPHSRFPSGARMEREALL
jgi:hypothetical protein